MKQQIFGLVLAMAMIFSATAADAQGRGWKKGHYKHHYKHKHHRGYYYDRTYRGSYYYGHRVPRPPRPVIVAPPPPPRPVFIAPPPPPRPPHPFHRW